MGKQFKQSIRRISAMVTFRKARNAEMRHQVLIECRYVNARGVCQAVVYGPQKKVEEVFETTTFDDLRRIVTRYYPSTARAFGPARQWVHI